MSRRGFLLLPFLRLRPKQPTVSEVAGKLAALMADLKPFWMYRVSDDLRKKIAYLELHRKGAISNWEAIEVLGAPWEGERPRRHAS